MPSIKNLIEANDSNPEEIVKSLVEASPQWSPGNMDGNWEILDNAFSGSSDPKSQDDLLNKLVSKFNLKHQNDMPTTYADSGNNMFVQLDGGTGMVGVNLDGKYSKEGVEQALGI